MVAARTFLFTIALLALMASDSVTLGAKCYPETHAPVSAETPAPELVEETTPKSFSGSQTNDFPTQTATDAPAMETGSFGAPAAQSGSYEAPATETSSNGGTEDSSAATTQGSLESNDVSQGSSTQTQGSSGNSTGTGEHATFGKQTSTGKCVTGDPDTGDVTREMVDWVWKNTIEECEALKGSPPSKSIHFQ
ncbi:hypothetical protein DVH05_026306 [Phytophthora capsici]|nr:hypothetical protein DVH05_026306 [Phytophthora capsici]